MPGLRRTIPALLMGLLPTVSLILIGYTGSYTRYIADDYCSVYWARRFGLFRSVWHWYITWSGRFSAYAADWFVEQMGSRALGIVPPVTLTIWVAVSVLAIYLLIQAKQKEAGDWAIAFGLGLAFVFAFFSCMQSIVTTFYWWSGARSYALPLLFLTLFSVLYQWGIAKLDGTRWILAASLLSLVLCFANAGFGEVCGVTQLGLLSVFLMLHLIKKDRTPAPISVLAAGIAGTVLALIVIALSPGNPVREAALPPHPALVRLLSIAWQGYESMLQQIVLEPRILLAVVGTISAAAWAGTRMLRPAGTGRAAAVIIAVGLMVSYGGFVPGSWGLSELPPPRSVAVSQFALLASLFAAAYVMGSQLPRTTGRPALAWMPVAIAILCLSMSAGIDIPKRYAAIETYILYAQRWDDVEKQILQARAAGTASVTVPAWPNWAGPVVFSDNPKNWLNQCASGYYEIKIIGRAP